MISAVAWVRKGVSLQVPLLAPEAREAAPVPLDAKAAAKLAAKRAALEAAAAAPAAPVSGEGGMEEEEEEEEEGATSGEDDSDDDGYMDEMEEEEEAKDPQPVKEEGEEEDVMKKYNLDKYDEEETDSDSDMGAAEDQDEPRPDIPIFSNIRGLVYHANPQEDPYITLDPHGPESMEAQEFKELEIYPTDNLLLTAKTVDDVSYLEAYVYEEDEDNLYVHHDIMLPTFPLCLEWLDWDSGSGASGERVGGAKRQRGNMVAIGTFDPHVEIWDLDVLDAVSPQLVLGRVDPATAAAAATAPTATGKKKKGGPARLAQRVNPDTHVDAVLGLSWNTKCPHLLATASADATVKLWDLNSPNKALRSFHHHKNKVQCVQWNGTDPSVLLSGGYDKKVVAFDTRAPDTAFSWRLQADVECLRWSPWTAHEWFVSTEDGLVQCYDGRYNASGPLYTIHAHDAAVSALDLSPSVRGCLVTGSADRTVKVWNVADQQPRMLVSRDVGVGRVFSCSFCPDAVRRGGRPGDAGEEEEDGLVLAVAGAKDKVVLWNLGHNAGVRRAFYGKVAPEPSRDAADALAHSMAKELVMVESSEGEDEESGEEGGDADAGAR